MTKPLTRQQTKGEEVVELYRPSSGSEGCWFYEKWCANCARDKSMNGTKEFDLCEPEEVCTIISQTLAYSVDEPEYPKAWRDDKNGNPVCAEFIEAGQPIPHRCENTPDMFDTDTAPSAR